MKALVTRASSCHAAGVGEQSATWVVHTSTKAWNGSKQVARSEASGAPGSSKLGLCRGYAEAVQGLCRGSAGTVQGLCRGYAEAVQGLWRGYAAAITIGHRHLPTATYRPQHISNNDDDA